MKPPAKKRAIRKPSAAVVAKRHSHPKLPIGSRIKQHTVGCLPQFPADESTQELPGDSSAAANQPITSFSGISLADARAIASSTPCKASDDLKEFLKEHSQPTTDLGSTTPTKAHPRVMGDNISLFRKMTIIDSKGMPSILFENNCRHVSLIIDDDINLPTSEDQKFDGTNKSQEDILSLSAQYLCTSLTAELQSVSSDGSIKLVLVKQPEHEHRARYATEGSRGAVKDREGSGHPIIEVLGCKEPCVVQVFLATESGPVKPQLHLQACQVASKTISNITETNIRGTTVIQVPLSQTTNMRLVCDCVGILRKRKVDVTQRLLKKPSNKLAPKGKNGKKLSSKCAPTGINGKKKPAKVRMVFRAIVRLENGSFEVLQIASQPIICSEFITCINTDNMGQPWVNNYSRHHLICHVPPYTGPSISSSTIKVLLKVVSGTKSSDPHTFTYTREPSVEQLSSATECLPHLLLRCPCLELLMSSGAIHSD
ncbi:hypothetical protein HAZT_HAZT009469 [Hyalella azteca]|uniref:RHD domain-containing protein n=1 Tax=Hyalella azteca TaxID=294128 RepID=A0A6A0H5H9_HYAAZ|nr:hypothetical protein HAZT_HAZT009469 [Hyalella azteca]